MITVLIPGTVDDTDKQTAVVNQTLIYVAEMLNSDRQGGLDGERICVFSTIGPGRQ